MSYMEKLLEGVEAEWMALGEVANYRRGSFPQPYGESKWYNGEGAMPFVQVAEVSDNMRLVENTKRKISILAQPKSVFVPKGSVVVTLQGSIGRVAVTQYDSYVDRTLGIFESYKVEIDKKYFAYQLEAKFNIEKDSARGSTIKTITKEEFTKFPIPIPCPDSPEKSIAIQTEIVRILDTFTELTTELSTELSARKKQYNYYRDQLLSFEEGEVEWKGLGEVAVIGTGSHDTKDAMGDGNYIFYARGRDPLKLNVFDFDETAIITAGDGAGVGKVYHYAQGKYALHQRAYRIVPGEIMEPRFVYHYIAACFYAYIQKVSVSSSVMSLRRPMFLNFPIPVPSLKEQARIVAILDKFDTLTHSISEGLPREIELRQKQYEYYRDMLLSFPKAGAKA